MVRRVDAHINVTKQGRGQQKLEDQVIKISHLDYSNYSSLDRHQGYQVTSCMHFLLNSVDLSLSILLENLKRVRVGISLVIL